MTGINKVPKSKRLAWLLKYPDPLAALRRMNWSNAAIWRDSGGTVDKAFIREYRAAQDLLRNGKLGKKETKQIINKFIKPLDNTLRAAIGRKERLLGNVL